MTGALPETAAWLVLLVDDEPDVRRHLSRVLRLAVPTLRILEAANGEEGLELLSRNDVDLIVSDQRMPIMDGITFLTLAAKSAPLVPKILLTGYADVELAIRAVNDGHVSLFLQKPASNETIAREALKLLEARHQAAQKLRAFARTIEMSRKRIEPAADTPGDKEK